MFPTEFPTAAVRQIYRFLNGDDKDYGRLALAVYQCAGFGLGKAFPQTAFLSDSEPVVTQDELKLLGEATALSPELEAIIEVVVVKLLKLLLSKWL